MAMTRAEINAKSNAKRGVQNKTYKLHNSVINQIAMLSKELNIPQNQLIAQAIEAYAKSLGK